MPVYEHACSHCEEEFEDTYSMKAEPPTKCPLCGEEGGVKRLISLTAPGIVELTGGDLKQKLLADGRKLKHEALNNENKLANLIGEDKYQANQSKHEKVKTELSKAPAVKRKKSGGLLD